jgi:hypothetical protein
LYRRRILISVVQKAEELNISNYILNFYGIGGGGVGGTTGASLLHRYTLLSHIWGIYRQHGNNFRTISTFEK